MSFHAIHQLADITPAWLTSLMARRYPDLVVTDVQIGTVIGGTATKIHLTLRYNDAGVAAGLPTSLWLKAGFDAHAMTEHMKTIYLGEALFYRDVAEKLDLGPPRAYAVEIDDQTGQSYILLEDLLLLGARFGHSTEPLTPDTAADVLELLARLHARFWGDPWLDQFSWLAQGGAMGQSGVHDFTFAAEIWERCIALPRGQYMTGPLGDRDKMHKAMQRVLQSDQGRANCLVHGDSQLMNIFFTQDHRPGFLDWQTAMKGFWAHDVTEFLVTALPVTDRRTHERQLIAHYSEALRSHGVDGPDAEKAWQEYLAHLPYTFHWMLCQPEWQPEPVCLANAERAFAAIQDHEAVK